MVSSLNSNKMKQFFVFIYSKFSQPSLTCESIIRSLPSDLNVNFLCVDNIETRRIIQEDITLDIKLVPCLLIVNTEGRITKYEGRKCHEYLSHYQKQQTVVPDPEPISLYQQPPPPAQQAPPPAPSSKPSPKQLPTKQIQQRQQQDVIHQQMMQQQAMEQQQQSSQREVPLVIDDDDNFNSNPVDGNQTSLLDDDDDDDEHFSPQQPPPTPTIPNKMTSKGKPSLIAQATAMQKSRLMDDEFANGKKK